MAALEGTKEGSGVALRRELGSLGVVSVDKISPFFAFFPPGLPPAFRPGNPGKGTCEANALTGPFRMVSYWQAFGPQAYFVALPSVFAARSLSTDANGTHHTLALGDRASSLDSGSWSERAVFSGGGISSGGAS